MKRIPSHDSAVFYEEATEENWPVFARDGRVAAQLILQRWEGNKMHLP
jgi:hypothetical protein